MEMFAPRSARTRSLAALGALVCLAACATAVRPEGTGAGGSDASGGGGSGGTGGLGGSTASSSVSTTASATTGAGGAESPCAQDCSTIALPPCFAATCNEQTGNCDVLPAADGAACDDGAYCTEDDVCEAGQCKPGLPRNCAGSTDPCVVSVCDEALDTCSASPAPNGSLCTSSDPCLSNTQCFNGQCLGAPKDCSGTPVPDQCHVAVCDPMQGGACVPVPGNDGLACTGSGDPCMVSKVCMAGSCGGGTPKNCSSFTNGCNNGLCNPQTGACFAQPVGPGGMCLEASNACNQGICNANGQCIGSPVNNGGMCNDGSSCTINDLCNNGTCGGTPDPGYTIYFSDDFSGLKGWTLGTEWQIGTAVASMGHAYGNADPSTDFSPTADNRIAGVVLGGNAATTALHGFYYLESPVINTAAAANVVLQYQRWLNSDYTPFMQNNVEVFNGTTWVVVWQSAGAPGVQDNAWSKQTHDISIHKNANMRVRFGFNVGSSGVFTVSSWNLDDVVVASAGCN